MTNELTLNKAATKIHAANNKFGKQFSEWVVIVGEQLRKTQEQLATHKAGFEAWCKSEFDWSSSRVYQIMDASDTVLLTSTIVEVAPSNEAQCRELLKAPKEDIPEVWRDVVESAAGGTITAKMIAERIQNRIDASKPKPKPPSKPTEHPAKSTEQETPDVVSQPQDTTPVVDHVEPEVSDKPAPVNDWKMARSKAKKTAEALQRAIGDLNDVRKFAYTATALDDIREIIVALDAMK